MGDVHRLSPTQVNAPRKSDSTCRVMQLRWFGPVLRTPRRQDTTDVPCERYPPALSLQTRPSRLAVRRTVAIPFGAQKSLPCFRFLLELRGIAASVRAPILGSKFRDEELLCEEIDSRNIMQNVARIADKIVSARGGVLQLPRLPFRIAQAQDSKLYPMLVYMPSPSPCLRFARGQSHPDGLMQQRMRQPR